MAFLLFFFIFSQLTCQMNFVESEREKERKFYSIFFKKSQVSKGRRPVVALRKARNTNSFAPGANIYKEKAIRRLPADDTAL